MKSTQLHSDEMTVIFSPENYVTIPQLEYENLIRADETLKIATELVQVEKDDYANIKSLKIVLGVTENEEDK